MSGIDEMSIATAPQNGDWLHLERFGMVLPNGDFVLCHATYNPWFFYLTCIDHQDGSQKWQIETQGHQTPDLALSPDGTTLYLHAGGPIMVKAYTFDENNVSLKWQFNPNFFPEQQSELIVTTDGSIVSAGKRLFGSDVIKSLVVALNDNGSSASLKWETQTFDAEHVPWSQLAEGTDGSIYAAIGYPTADWGPDTLYRIDPSDGSITGDSGPMAGLECRSGLATAHDGKVYAGTDGYVYCFNADASLAWSYPGGNFTDAALDADGSLFVADVTNGKLYRFQTE